MQREPWIPGYFKDISGAMFTGKTKLLVNEFYDMQEFEEIAKREIRRVAFKPILDDRFPPNEIKSRAGLGIPCIPIEQGKPESMLEYITAQTKVVAIDEMQFFNDKLLGVIDYLRDQKKYVIGTMLDRDFRNEPFNIAPLLLVYADEVVKTTGICMTCRGENGIGTYTQRLVNGQPAPYDDPQEVIEHDKERQEQEQQNKEKRITEYELRCKACYIPPGKPAYEVKVNV